MLAKSPVTLSRVNSFYKEKRLILKEEGFLGLAEILKDILTKAKKAIFSFERFDIYKYDLTLVSESPLEKCKLDGLLVKPFFIPITLQEYEHLGTRRFDFSKHAKATEYGESSGKGTIVFCTFKDGDLVNRTGMTLYRNGVYEYVYPAESENGSTVYAGFSETTKKFRRMCVYSYVHSYIYRYLRNKGFSKVILLESEEQAGPRKVQERLGAKIIGQSYIIRFFLFINFRWNRTKV